jgi:hypothetical protein
MATPSPQTISSDIIDSLKLLALNGGKFAAVDLRKSQILAECDKLAKIDAIAASLLKAQLFALLGDRKTAEYWIRNAEMNRAVDQALNAKETVLVLLGCASEAFEIFDRAVLNMPSQALLRHAISFGWFRKAEALLSKLNEKEVSDDNKLLIEEGRRYLDLLGVGEPQMCRIMDIALGVLRENELIWVGSLPEFSFVPAHVGGPLLCITYRVEMTPAQASELNAVFVDRLVAANLDALGVMVGYSGIVIEAPPRAQFVH